MRKKQNIVPGILLLLALVFAVLAVREYLPYWINEFQMEQRVREKIPGSIPKKAAESGRSIGRNSTK